MIVIVYVLFLFLPFDQSGISIGCPAGLLDSPALPGFSFDFFADVVDDTIKIKYDTIKVQYATIKVHFDTIKVKYDDTKRYSIIQ